MPRSVSRPPPLASRDKKRSSHAAWSASAAMATGSAAKDSSTVNVVPSFFSVASAGASGSQIRSCGLSGEKIKSSKLKTICTVQLVRKSELDGNLGDLYTESGQTLQGSFSAASTPIFASKYALESSRRDLHNALLCTVL